MSGGDDIIYKIVIECGGDTFEKVISFALWKNTWFYERFLCFNNHSESYYVDVQCTVISQDVYWNKGVVEYKVICDYEFSNVNYIDGYIKR